MPEFNLRQLQDIEYISDTLVRPRGYPPTARCPDLET
jgi:hypothetical protein